jgi:mRNA-degrading endonuclease toxin of MazEF toxin-antitoxin module
VRPIYWADLDKRRPVLLLTPARNLTKVTRVTVAPILGSTPGFATHLTVGTAEGLETSSSIRCEGITTIERQFLFEQIGVLDRDREVELRAAIVRAFDLPTIYDEEED